MTTSTETQSQLLEAKAARDLALADAQEAYSARVLEINRDFVSVMRADGRPTAELARELGINRQHAHSLLARFPA